jgi:hypothetical protein
LDYSDKNSDTECVRVQFGPPGGRAHAYKRRRGSSGEDSTGKHRAVDDVAVLAQHPGAGFALGCHF